MGKTLTLDVKKGGMRMSERLKKARGMAPRTETLYFLMQFARSVRPLGLTDPLADIGLCN